MCRPCTERSLTGQGPRGFEPADLNRRTAGHGGISRRKEDEQLDFQPAGALPWAATHRAASRDVWCDPPSLCRRRRNPRNRNSPSRIVTPRQLD